MKEYNAEQIRNLAFVGHGGSGKTSFAESLLFTCKAVNRLGKIEDGATCSDYTEEEIKRNISITGTLLYCEYKNHKINVIDLPGYSDFLGEVYGGLRIVDTGVLIIDSLAGPEAGSENNFTLAEQYKSPLVILFNKIDRESVNFNESVTKCQSLLSNRALPVQLPIGEGLDFKGYIDLLKMKGFEYSDDGKTKEIDIPEDMKATAEEAREKLIEAAAESDDALLEKFFEAGDLSPEDITAGVKKAVAERVLFPILIASSIKNQGAIPFLDFVTQYLPSPADIKEINVLKGDELTTQKIGDDQPPIVFIFKTLVEKHVGELSLFRIYSGSIKHGDELYNVNREHSEKIGQIYAINGKNRNEAGVIHAGDMGALVKLKDTHTSDTLGTQQESIKLPPIEFPAPTIEFAIHAAGKGDEEKIAVSLNNLRREDPTFVVEMDPELKQTVIKGQGELHLDVLNSKLKSMFAVEMELTEPKIPFRETITGKTETQYRHKKQTGGKGQFGDVHIRLAPLPRGKGFEFVNEITGGVIPAKFIPSVEKGVIESMQEGGLSGNKVVDVTVTLFFGSYHNVDSSDMAFKIAGSMAFKNGFNECKPVLLEPIYDLEIRVPDENTGDIMGDMSSRRGKIMGMEPMGKYQMVKAQAPLAELFKYATALRSMTGGRGRHSQVFSHYESVPREVTDKIVEAYQKARAEGN